MDRRDAAALDETSPLRELRDRFSLPEGVVYLDGNSLGALPTGVAARLAAAVQDEWGRGLIRSWNDAEWIDLPARVGDRIAPLIGAAPGDVHVGDSTSISLFKTMAAALRARPERRVLVLEPSTFPTDGYVAHGVAALTGAEIRWCDPADPLAAVDDDVALLSLTHVDFRTGAMFDLPAITAAARARGALVQWDLCHSAGAVEVDLTAAGADLAVGCTYKYLNGGPGSPAYTWVHPRLQAELENPLPGWMGHAQPFAMSRDYAPRDGVARFATGTPPVLALTALDAAMEVFEGVDQAVLREVSLSLTSLFLRLLDERLGDRIDVVTPREAERRGSQVSFRHPDSYGIVAALIARGVIGDWRDPDIARFGFAPLYVRHVDVHDAVEHLVAVLDAEEHLDPAHRRRNAVT